MNEQSPNRLIALDIVIYIAEQDVKAGRRLWGGDNELLYQTKLLEAALDQGLDSQMIWYAIRLLRIAQAEPLTTQSAIAKAKKLSADV